MESNKRNTAIIGLVIFGVIVLLTALILIIVLESGEKPEVITERTLVLNQKEVKESIIKGTTKKVGLTASVKYPETQNGEAIYNEADTFEWSIDNDKIATLDATGNKATLTLKAGGMATVTVSSKGLKVTCNVVVTELLPKLTLSQTTINETLIKGKTKAISLTAISENIPELANLKEDSKQLLTWKSSNTKVATVEANNTTANVTIKAAGTTTITVAYGDLTATCDVTVVEVNPKITLSTTSVSKKITSGKTQTVELVATTENVSGELTWKSSNTKVATVKGNKDNATVTLKAGGTAIISVTDGNVTEKCTIKVAEIKTEAKEVVVIMDTDEINRQLIKGKTEKFTITATIANINSTNLRWTSNNTSVAKVSGNGNKATVTIVGGGTATITVSGGGKSDTCKIVVEQLNPTITLNKTTITEKKNELATKTVGLVATTTHIDPGTKLTWSSSNTGVATVDQNGNVTLVYKGANSTGTANITVTGGGATATCEVKVTNLKPVITPKQKTITITDINNNVVGIEYTFSNVEQEKITYTTNSSDALVWLAPGENWVCTLTKPSTTPYTVTAKYGSATATWTINFKPSISFSKSSYSLTKVKYEPGIPTSVTATLTNIDESRVSWKSSNTNVVSVSGNGKLADIYPQGAGTATVTITDGITNTSKSIEVTVTEIERKMNLSDKLTINCYKGRLGVQTATITATLENMGGGVTWTSGDQSKVKVVSTANSDTSSTVTLLIVGGGKVTITAQSDEFSWICKTCTVTVNVPEPSITFDKTSITVSNKIKLVDVTRTLTVTEENTEQLEWKSSDRSVATVSYKNGIATITCKNEGTTTITATYASVTAECTVTVSELTPVLKFVQKTYTIDDGDYALFDFTYENLDVNKVKITSDPSSMISATYPTFSSENSGTLGVDVTGYGTVKVTLSYADVSTTCTITRNASLFFYVDSITTLYEYDKTISITPELRNIPPKEVVWTNHNPEVVSLGTGLGDGETAMAYIKGIGTAEITARHPASGKSATYTIIVDYAH